jgi:hypothetical protein
MMVKAPSSYYLPVVLRDHIDRAVADHLDAIEVNGFGIRFRVECGLN